MKKITLLLLLAVFAINTKAQTVEFIEPRNVQSVPEAEFTTYKVGDYCYVLQKKYRMMAPVMYDLQLDAYDAARKPVGTTIIDKTLEMGDANIYQGVFPLKDKLVMFKSEYSKVSGSKMSYFYVYPFDVTGKRLKKTTLVTINAESAFNSGNFGVQVSPDGTKVAVLSEQPYDKEGMERCTVTVFDDQFKQLWKKDYTFPYESAKAPKNEILVNNTGTVFILKKIAIKKAFDQFAVFSFSDNGKTVTEKKIELDNGFTISTWKSVFTAEGNLQLAGFFYMDKKVGINVETPDGTFLINVNAGTGELKAAKANMIRSTNIKATQLLATPDNGLVLVGESMTINSTPKPGVQFEYNYEYKSGITHLIKMNMDGAVQWDYAAEKDLRSGGDGGRFLTSFSWVHGNDIQLLFVDQLSRHDNKRQFIEFGSRWCDVIQTIGPDGKLKVENMITDQRIGGKKGEYTFIPATGSLYKDQKIFMLAARGLELVGATISY
jgi:hypothetical protein